MSMKKGLLITGIVILAVFALFFYVRFYYVFAEGAKSGELNYVVKKGYIFKTYEGKMIQSGFQTDSNKGIQSNEFLFSVTDHKLADSLMHMYEGKVVTLNYKEYFGRLPWRGYTKYVVDKVVAVRDKTPEAPIIPLQ